MAAPPARIVAEQVQAGAVARRNPYLLVCCLDISSPEFESSLAGQFETDIHFAHKFSHAKQDGQHVISPIPSTSEKHICLDLPEQGATGSGSADPLSHHGQIRILVRNNKGGATVGSTCIPYPNGLLPNETVDRWVPLSNQLDYSKEYDFHSSAASSGSNNPHLLRLRLLIKYVDAEQASSESAIDRTFKSQDFLILALQSLNSSINNNTAAKYGFRVSVDQTGTKPNALPKVKYIEGYTPNTYSEMMQSPQDLKKLRSPKEDVFRSPALNFDSAGKKATSGKRPDRQGTMAQKFVPGARGQRGISVIGEGVLSSSPNKPKKTNYKNVKPKVYDGVTAGMMNTMHHSSSASSIKHIKAGGYGAGVGGAQAGGSSSSTAPYEPSMQMLYHSPRARADVMAGISGSTLSHYGAHRIGPGKASLGLNEKKGVQTYRQAEQATRLKKEVEEVYWARSAPLRHIIETLE